MSELKVPRAVVCLDTNSLHYLDLFMRYVQEGGFAGDDVGNEELVTQLEQVDEVRYKKSPKMGAGSSHSSYSRMHRWSFPTYRR